GWPGRHAGSRTDGSPLGWPFVENRGKSDRQGRGAGVPTSMRATRARRGPPRRAGPGLPRTLVAMAGDDDLDWLYGRDRRGRRPEARPGEPDGTKVFTPQERAEIGRRARAAGEVPPRRTPARPVPPAAPPQEPPT